MKTPSQIVLALTIVILSVGALVIFSRGEESGGQGEEAGAGADAGMEGHDHSAMSAGSDGPQMVSLSADASRRIGVTYATVTRGTLPQTVRTVGSVTYDETGLSTISPKFEGWVERLFVDFTGATVQAGEPLLEVYSPALVTAQEELFLAMDLLHQAQESGGDRAKENAEKLVAAAHRRLAYWDIPEDVIREMKERGTVHKTLALRAPRGGVVVEKNVVEGTRIMPGMELFRVADLSRVWVEAEIFEKDLSLVGLGQHAMVSLESYPGEMFHGSVTYVHPTVSASARTGRVRVELQNPELRLKPGMYAQVELHGISMEETLLVPSSAILETGERTMVFHRMSNGQLHPMEVVTGLSSGDQVQILSGLNEGHIVVASATFLIDAESNLGAAMAAMAGMDHSAMDMGGMDMGGGESGAEAVGAMAPDTAGTAVDHSGHDMSGMVPDTAVRRDTSRAAGAR